MSAGLITNQCCCGSSSGSSSSVSGFYCGGDCWFFQFEASDESFTSVLNYVKGYSWPFCGACPGGGWKIAAVAWCRWLETEDDYYQQISVGIVFDCCDYGGNTTVPSDDGESFIEECNSELLVADYKNYLDDFPPGTGAYVYDQLCLGRIVGSYEEVSKGYEESAKLAWSCTHQGPGGIEESEYGVDFVKPQECYCDRLTAGLVI